MKNFVYDLPTRIFHWLFAGFFLTAFTIAKTIEDDSALYVYHMLAGLTLGFMVLLRIVWGFTGTQHARFSGFALKPLDSFHYFKGLVTGSKQRWAGHNPASSWAGLLMMLLALGLGLTGYLMTSGPNKEDFEDIHELFANGFIIIVIFHVLGIILHTLRHKEMIGLSMIDGKKLDILEGERISSQKSKFGILFLLLVFTFTFMLLKKYDSNTGSLSFFGSSLQLGENQQE